MASLRRLLMILLTTAAVLFAGRALADQWHQFRSTGATVHVRLTPLALSGVLVLVAYAVLIETWRRTVASWGASLPWGAAARIWFVSNLGRYLPGKVWQIGAMGALAQRQGVSPVVATGSALVVNLVNLLAGIGVVSVTGARALGRPGTAAVLALALAFATLFASEMIRGTAALASRLLGKELDVPRLPRAALAAALAGCTIAWLLYGTAFRFLAASVLGSADGPWADYVAAFTGSYLAGYIALFAPGGIGVRELSLVAALNRMGLVVAGGASVVVLASRIWLTVLEVVPGALFLAAAALRRGAPSSPQR